MKKSKIINRDFFTALADKKGGISMKNPSKSLLKNPSKVQCPVWSEIKHNLKINVHILHALLILLFITGLVFTMITAVSQSASAQFLRCSVCGNTIKGNYWKYGDKVICDQCRNSLPTCEMCGIPVKKYQDVEGHKICPDCYENKLTRCEKCKTPIYTYWNWQGPDGKNHKLCKNCLDKTLGYCQLCGKSLVGKSWTVTSDSTGRTGKYCDYCKNNSHTCFYCSLLVSAKAQPLQDGRYICSYCGQNLLSQQSDYKKIKSEVNSVMVNELNIQLKHTPSLSLVDLPKLKKLVQANQSSDNTTGGDNMGLYVGTKLITTDSRGKKTTKLQHGDIYILNYMPRDVAIWVMAHEMAHGWYEERVFSKKEPMIVEGFAEWVAYHVLKKKGLNTLAESLTKREDEVYGKGLRFLLKIEKEKGFKGVLDYVTR